ncbi:hypothetical protein CYLTODRAFT_452066 [Cylindrobasidium torrendii FP15055 ss-10]|uniref:Zn(2)-C6 fungal-type domain-containing protein n=1 Tax=Cylindrobasidium torrendii FP15055 ss-10 TaxID=1314674 RepID=A0A0D7BIX4_9AGAR|nr:hypothetical protein CYLTODRAFT_452066 [Cylindrobasidium torrendii FP15055 ss-10]
MSTITIDFSAPNTSTYVHSPSSDAMVGSPQQLHSFTGAQVDASVLYDTTASAPGRPVRQKRRQVKNACVKCQKACKKCEDVRPCARCTRYGTADECVDSKRKERRKGFKRGPYKKRDDKGRRDEVAKAKAAAALGAPAYDSPMYASHALAPAPPEHYAPMPQGMDYPPPPYVPHHQDAPMYAHHAAEQAPIYHQHHSHEHYEQHQQPQHAYTSSHIVHNPTTGNPYPVVYSTPPEPAPAEYYPEAYAAYEQQAYPQSSTSYTLAGAQQYYMHQ